MELQVLLKKETPNATDMNVLAVAGDMYINRRGIEKSDTDSATLCANKLLIAGVKAKNDVWRGKAYVLFSKILRETGNNTGGRQYITKAKDILDQSGDSEALGDMYIELAMYYDPHVPKELSHRILLHERASKLFATSGNKLKQAHALAIQGDNYNEVPDFRKAEAVLLQALALYKETGYPELGAVYDLLGLSYKSTGDLNKALEYGLLSMKAAEARKDTTEQICTTYNRLGMIFFDLGEDAKALDYFKKSFAVASRLRDTASMQVLTSNIANSYYRLDRIPEALAILKEEERNYPPKDMRTRVSMLAGLMNCYVGLQKLEPARPYVDGLLSIRQALDRNEIEREFATAPLIRYYLAAKQYETARRYIIQMDSMTQEHKHLAPLTRNYLFWFRADSALGDYQAAIKHYQLYKFYNDSLFSVAKTSQINQLQIQFETEQKDQALKLNERNIELLTREAQLQKAELNRTRFTRNVIIAGAAMLVLLLLLGYNRYQLKLRSNRQMKEQQEEINKQNQSLQALIAAQHKLLEEKEWLVKEIHHRVKNNLQIVMSLLNTQAAFLDDKDALNAIRESRYRMQAISLIHQKLYQSENMALIDMHAYIHDLVLHLKDGFSGINRINFDLQIAPVKLDVSHSVPVGLILNEAITNAIKYAFTGQGTIIVSLQQTGPELLTLVVADNGKGLPANKDQGRRRSMGMMLMHTLAEQLEGTLNIQTHNGVIITVNFKYQEKQAYTEPLAFEEKATHCA
jgi:two-component sensor histidine kinase